MLTSRHELKANFQEVFSMKPVYLTAAVRTPIGRFGGSLKDLRAADMGVAVAKESSAPRKHSARADSRFDLGLCASGRRRTKRGAADHFSRRRA